MMKAFLRRSHRVGGSNCGVVETTRRSSTEEWKFSEQANERSGSGRQHTKRSFVGSAFLSKRVVDKRCGFGVFYPESRTTR